MLDDMYGCSTLTEVAEYCPNLNREMESRGIVAILIMRVAVDMKGFGYLMIGEPNVERIWQEDEKAILFFTARMLAGSLERNHQTL